MIKYQGVKNHFGDSFHTVSEINYNTYKVNSETWKTWRVERGSRGSVVKKSLHLSNVTVSDAIKLFSFSL